MLDLSGYVRVDEFDDDDQYEDDEVHYVTLDLGATQPTLLSSSETYKLIGLESETPYLQLSGTIFKGQQNTLLGTELLFSEEISADRNKKSASFLATTQHRICFKEVQLVPKQQAEEEPVASSSTQQQKTTSKDTQVRGFFNLNEDDWMAEGSAPSIFDPPVQRKKRGPRKPRTSKTKDSVAAIV